MIAFKFKFESLLRYRKSRRDLYLQTLAQVLAQDRELATKQQSLERTMLAQSDDLRALGQQGTFEIDAARSRQIYIGQLTVEIRQLEQQRELIARQIELCRAAVTQADQDATILEKLAEKQSTAFRYAQQRRDVRELDESCRPAKAA